ncbi:MAG: ABC transporter ATP-binding protein [Thermoguttaceae bacterium]
MTDPVVDIRRLVVHRAGRDILAVDGATAPSGQVVAILGPNGAGKSTLLKCLMGLVRPSGGQIHVLDCPITSRSSGWSLCRLRRRIGYVPQTLAAAGETPLTVREVTAIGRTGIAGLFRRLSRDDWRRVDFWLESLGLGDLAERTYSSLSGGEQRKTLIAKAMVQEPDLLLLDEPTANLDLRWREQIVAILDRLHRDTRLTVLLVCHELEVIPACCRRLWVLRDGRLSADGSPSDVLTPGLIESLYGSRLKLIADRGRYCAAPAGGPLEWT